MPRGNRTLGQVYFARFESEDGSFESPTQVALIRHEADDDEGAWVFIRPAVHADRDAVRQLARTTRGAEVPVVVERSSRLYLRVSPPAAWSGETIERFGLAEGDSFAMAEIAQMPILGADIPEAAAFEIGSPSPPSVRREAAPARALGAAPFYAAQVAGPEPWVPPRDAVQVAGARVGGDPPSGAHLGEPSGAAGPAWAPEPTAYELVLDRLTRLELQLEARTPEVSVQRRGAAEESDPGPHQLFGVGPSRGAQPTNPVDSARELLGLPGMIPTRQPAAFLRFEPPARTPERREPETALTVHDLLRVASDLHLGSRGGRGDEGAGYGARGLETLERRRRKHEDDGSGLWRWIQGEVNRRTRVRGGGLLAYFSSQTAIQHHEMALFFLHLIERIADAAERGDGNKVLGGCASAVVFLDQAIRDEGNLRLAREVALVQDPELPYMGPENEAAKRSRARYAKPYSPLCQPATYAAVAAALGEVEKLAKAGAAPAKK